MDANGHLQATGRDARGRKQYRYHPHYRTRRDEAKFERLVAFAKALPAIRAQVDKDLGRQGLPREKVLAAVVRLLELTLIRVGNEEYARLNRSFGLTTLQNRHATVTGGSVRFRFRGKSGQLREVGLRDRRLATIIKRCRDLPGQDLFQYIDEDGEAVEIQSDDVNDYLRTVAPDITAKDFRTWAGTVLAYRALGALDAPGTEGEAKRNVVAAIRETAERLGNTPAVCRQAYVHPIVVEAYLDPKLRTTLVRAAESTGATGAATPAEERGGSPPASAPASSRRRPHRCREPDMAIIAGLFGLIGRFAGKVLMTTLGWASTLLFGRVPQDRQIVLAFITFGAVAWAALVVGVVLPYVGAFLLAAVPPQGFISESWLRLGMVVGALVVPAIVGVATLFVVEPARRPAGAAMASRLFAAIRSVRRSPSRSSSSPSSAWRGSFTTSPGDGVMRTSRSSSGRRAMRPSSLIWSGPSTMLACRSIAAGRRRS